MEKFSFISAIIGGLITAVFTYLIQVLLYRRSEKKRRRQLAFLYLTRISQIVAVKKTIESLSVYKEGIEKIKNLKIKGVEVTDYVLHMACVGLIEVLQDKSKLLDEFKPKLSDFFSSPPMRRALNIAKGLMGQDKYFGYKIDDEVLLSLPADSIVQYDFFIDRISSIHTTLSDWILAIESNDFSLLDADTLFQQLISFKRVVGNAENLRSSLIIKAKIKNKEAAGILGEQVKYYSKEILTLEKDKMIMGIFKKFIEKAKQDKEAQVVEK